jgi:hypothetical protein
MSGQLMTGEAAPSIPIARSQAFVVRTRAVDEAVYCTTLALDPVDRRQCHPFAAPKQYPGARYADVIGESEAIAYINSTGSNS